MQHKLYYQNNQSSGLQNLELLLKKKLKAFNINIFLIETSNYPPAEETGFAINLHD